MYQIDYHHPVHVYFIGIGGISMSGLAHILKDKSFPVSGSDAKRSEMTEVLEKAGIPIFYGQKEENILQANPKIDVVVYTAAVHRDNPEYQAACKLHLPMLTRAQLLGQIMKFYDFPVAIAGTHGKTSTTSMLSKILLEADMDPTLSIGGVFRDIGGNIRVGHSGYFVTEACEYTNSYHSFFPKVSVILDIDADHLDFFKDLNEIRASFAKFASLLPADGALVINGEIDRLEEITAAVKGRILTYGLNEHFDYYATDITYDQFACPAYTLHKKDGSTDRITLRIPGLHNVYNSMAAIAAADLMQVPEDRIRTALKNFSGTNRRFERKGEVDGVTIIDDYAHHPTEIRATLTAARNYPHKTLWCVFQPHTYTRTKALMHDFAEALCLADKIVLADIYAARETDHLGISSKTLQEEIRKTGHECDYFPSFSEIEKFLLQNCTKNDVLITMGAGDVVKIGEDLLGR